MNPCTRDRRDVGAQRLRIGHPDRQHPSLRCRQQRFERSRRPGLPGQEPHDLELTPQQVASLEEADLVVYLKGFQPAVDKAVEQSGAKNKLDLSQVIQLHPATEDHDHGTTDPHFWLDPTLEAKAVSAIANELSKIDANNKSTYETNAKSTTDEVAKAIAGDLGLRTAVLDPIEGITAESAGQDYPSVMKANLDAIKQSNGCS